MIQFDGAPMPHPLVTENNNLKKENETLKEENRKLKEGNGNSDKNDQIVNDFNNDLKNMINLEFWLSKEQIRYIKNTAYITGLGIVCGAVANSDKL